MALNGLHKGTAEHCAWYQVSSCYVGFVAGRPVQGLQGAEGAMTAA